MSKRHLYRPPLNITMEVIGKSGIAIFVKDTDNFTLGVLGLSQEKFDKFFAAYLRKRGLSAFVVKDKGETEMESEDND